MSAVRINGKHFRTKEYAEGYFNLILKQYEEYESINQSYFEDVLCLFAHHPEAAEKAYTNIVDILCVKHPEYKTKCFAIKVEDESVLDVNTFSVRKCLTNFNYHKADERLSKLVVKKEI